MAFFFACEQPTDSVGGGQSAGTAMRVAILGFGTVGQSVARLLLERHPERLRLMGLNTATSRKGRRAWSGVKKA